MALRATVRIIARNRGIVLDDLRLLDPFFERHTERIAWVRPKGGCTGFPRLRSGLTPEEIAARLEREEGVLVLPGAVYDWPGCHFRIGFGRRSMPEALDRFERFVSRL